jgi:hypothetical protein
MKKVNLALGVMLTAGSFMGCHGDHSVSNGKDTEQNSYKVGPDSSKLDTSKVTAGDASAEDNSASGGTKIAKDTSKTDTAKKH